MFQNCGQLLQGGETRTDKLVFWGRWKVVLFTNLCYKDNHVLQEPANSIVISIYCLLVSVAGKGMFRIIVWQLSNRLHEHLSTYILRWLYTHIHEILSSVFGNLLVMFAVLRSREMRTARYDISKS